MAYWIMNSHRHPIRGNYVSLPLDTVLFSGETPPTQVKHCVHLIKIELPHPTVASPRELIVPGPEMSTKIYKGCIRTRADVELLGTVIPHLEISNDSETLIDNCVIIEKEAARVCHDQHEWEKTGEDNDDFIFYHRRDASDDGPRVKSETLFGLLRLTQYTFGRCDLAPCHDEGLLKNFKVSAVSHKPNANSENCHSHRLRRSFCVVSLSFTINW